MHHSQYLEDTLTCIATTEASACDSNTVVISSDKSVDINYDTIFDDDLVIDEMLIVATTYYKRKKNSTAADHLSKI